MRTWLLLLVLLMLWHCLGCKHGPKIDWIAETQKAEGLYSSSDIKEAEHALLEYSQRLAAARPDEVRGIDYDFCLGMAHGRLFLIYQKTGNQQQANSHFQKSVDYLNRRRVKGGSPATNYTPGALTKLLEQADSTSPVRWKAE